MPEIVEQLRLGHINKLISTNINQDGISLLKRSFPKQWKTYIQTLVEIDQYYYALIWEHKYIQAMYFTQQLNGQLELTGIQ